MKRVRKVLDRNRPNALIDLHSANQYNVRDGFASSANLYLEHFPYLEPAVVRRVLRLQLGARLLADRDLGHSVRPDGRDARRTAATRGAGMVFGMTGRLPWAGDPRSMWKAWDEFGIADSRMIGFWVPAHPVKTGRPDVLATAYVREGRTMVAVASWAKDSVDVHADDRLEGAGAGSGEAPASVAPAIAGSRRRGRSIPAGRFRSRRGRDGC